jgi:endo-1,4-beta-D-glucanase Y
MVDTPKNRLIGIVLILLAVGIAATVTYKNSHKSQEPIVFSPPAMLSELWNSYKKEYLEASTGRTLDKQREFITTSEGESYSMLRAVWQDDKSTFDKSLQWSKDNLHRPGDHLFSWLFGKRSDGTYGILEEKGGQNTASDADSDIALSLLFASSRWGQPSYYYDAKAIINDMWNNEVVTVAGVPYLAANNLEKNSPTSIVVNPSYFAPYAYRMFATVDTSHDWNALVNSSYDVISKSSALPLDTQYSVGLPPDWVVIDRKTGAIEASTIKTLPTNYSYDALRTPWRLALDYQWYHDSRDKATLEHFKFLGDQWKASNAINTVYTHSGFVTAKDQAPAMYGGSLGYFIVADPANAKKVYEQKLKVLYNPNTQNWTQVLGYYDDNWAWFGIGLYNNALPNIYGKP